MSKFYIKNDDGSYTEAKALSQDEVDAVVQDRLKRESAKYSDYDDLKAKAKSVDELTAKHAEEINKLKAEIKTANEATTAAKLTAAKEKAMRDFGIKDSLAEFVTGNSEDELRTKAEKLAHEVPSNRLTFEKDSSTTKTKQSDNLSNVAEALLGHSE